MQQRPKDRTSRSIRAQRTQPALPVNTPPTAPLIVAGQQNQYRALPQPSGKKRSNPAHRAAWKLCGLGLLLAMLYFAFYPLLAGAAADHSAAKQALLSVFPWLPHLYWTTWAPVLAQDVSRIPMFNLEGGRTLAYANLLLVLLALAFVCLLVCVRIAARVIKERLSPGDVRLMFGVIFAFTALFSIIFLFAPPALSQDVLLYATYGRMVTLDHLNPYVVAGTLSGTSVGVAPYGPVWIDLSLPVALLARGSAASSLVGFRLVGLVAHLANTLLLWAILARLKPQARITGVLLYAWNPLVLLVGVGEMHYDIVVILLILLGTFLFQRHSWMPSWVFLLLAALINALCLLFLLLFVRLYWKESRTMGRGRRFLWWLALACVSAGIVILAYLPFRQGWSIAGIAASIGRAFVQDTAGNSLDAVVLHLPIASSPALSWIIAPHHWTLLAAVIVGGLLLFGWWLADTLELVLSFQSWIFLALFVLLPMNEPWYILLPLVLAITSATRPTILLAMLLTIGAALQYYFLLWPQVWPGQALVTVGLPLVAWGWTLFFTSTWHMAHPVGEVGGQQAAKPPGRGFSFSRPSWPSRSSWPRSRGR